MVSINLYGIYSSIRYLFIYTESIHLYGIYSSIRYLFIHTVSIHIYGIFLSIRNLFIYTVSIHLYGFYSKFFKESLQGCQWRELIRSLKYLSEIETFKFFMYTVIIVCARQLKDERKEIMLTIIRKKDLGSVFFWKKFSQFWFWRL